MSKQTVEISEWRNGKASPVGRLIIDTDQFDVAIADALDAIANGDDGCVADLVQFAESSTIPDDFAFGGGDVYELLPEGVR